MWVYYKSSIALMALIAQLFGTKKAIMEMCLAYMMVSAMRFVFNKQDVFHMSLHTNESYCNIMVPTEGHNSAIYCQYLTDERNCACI